MFLISLMTPSALAEDLPVTQSVSQRQTVVLPAFDPQNLMLVSVRLKNELEVVAWIEKDALFQKGPIDQLPLKLRDGSRVWVPKAQIIKIKALPKEVRGTERNREQKSVESIRRLQVAKKEDFLIDRIGSKGIFAFNGRNDLSERGSISQNAIITSWDQKIGRSGRLHVNTFSPAPYFFSQFGYRHAWSVGEMDEDNSFFTDLGVINIQDSDVAGLSVLLGYGGTYNDLHWSFSGGIVRFSPTYDSAFINGFFDNEGGNFILSATVQKEVGSRGVLISETWFSMPLDFSADYSLPPIAVEMFCYRHFFGQQKRVRIDLGGVGAYVGYDYSDEIRLFENVWPLPYAAIGYHY